MTIIVNPLALSWKHGSAQGIFCKQNAQGQMELISWPTALGAIPTQAQADAWAAEYALVDAKAKTNAPIFAQLVAKDRATDRRVREMVLRWAQMALPANDPDRVALEARDAEFTALRAQLQA